MEVDNSRRRQRGSVNDGSAQVAAGETLASARALLRSLHEHLASLGVAQLVELFGRVQSAYDEFPELELEFPRRDLSKRCSRRPVFRSTDGWCRC
jgi:hypothetical protein